ncbi:MAG: hypothetical protein K2X77_07780 [Candidatus Obscuribacterales bacterium]|nr:hypothetical protein [Candidatus Obscuribacterales bacterium]
MTERFSERKTDSSNNEFGGRNVPPLPPEFNSDGTNRQPNRDGVRFPEIDKRGKGPWWPVDRPPPYVPGERRFDREDKPGGWGVKWFEDGPILRPRPPEPKPEPPDTRNNGKIVYPDQIQPPLMSDTDARKSVNINADARWLYLTGAGTGAAVVGGTHFMDKYTGGFDPNNRQGLVKFWRDNLSPSERAVPVRKELLNRIDTEILPAAEVAANASGRTFARHLGYRSDLATKFVAETPKGPLPQLEAEFWKARVDLVRTDTSFTRANIMMNSGTPEQVAARTKLFTTHDATQLATQADEFWMASQANKTAADGLTAAKESRHAALASVTQAQRGSITTAGEALLKGAAGGLVVTTAAVIADNLLDRALGNSPELSNQAHWGLQGIGMPLMLASRWSMPAKLAGSLALIAGSHALDQAYGPPTGAFSAFARPSLPEIGLATAGAMMPVGDGKTKLALAAGGYLLGKTWNYLDAKYELTGRTEPGLRDASIAATEYDIKSPSENSFLFAAQEMRKFAEKNEQAASVIIRNWNLEHPNSLAIENERSAGAMMLGYAEAALAKGTRVDQDKFDKVGDRMLAGKDYDFGGQAANYFNAALDNLRAAEKLSRENQGRAIAGGVIDGSYTSTLLAGQARVTESLDKIYGSHDIEKVFAELKANVNSHESEMRKFGQNLKEHAELLTDRDPRYKAKIMRDLALLHLAYGERSIGTNGERRDHYDKALGYLEWSRRLDSKAPDWSAIYKIAANPK